MRLLEASRPPSYSDHNRKVMVAAAWFKVFVYRWHHAVQRIILSKKETNWLIRKKAPCELSYLQATEAVAQPESPSSRRADQEWFCP